MVRNIILHVCNLSKTFSCAENVLFDTKHDVVAISRFEDIHGEVIGIRLRPNLQVTISLDILLLEKSHRI